MPPAPLRADLSLLRQGASIGWEFGRHALVELARVAELVEISVYEKGSLRRIPDGVRFVLLNPPLRIGEFDRISIEWDGARVPVANWSVIAGSGPGRSGATIDPNAPLELPIGVRTIFELQVSTSESGDHSVRMELHNVAIPPMVWLEFSDKVTS